MRFSIFLNIFKEIKLEKIIATPIKIIFANIFILKNILKKSLSSLYRYMHNMGAMYIVVQITNLVQLNDNLNKKSLILFFILFL